ncbi:MAG: Permuted papain-like amidase enzyme YaeF/YiiX, family [Chloroflexota bacterium]
MTQRQTGIYEHSFHGIPVRTGDVICTTDGGAGGLYAALWQRLGTLVPGPIDHCAVYVGPGGRCVEAGARGVITFDMDDPWDAAARHDVRWLLDTFYGVAYPLAGRGLEPADEERIRAGVAGYCLEQAAARRPYNVNFLDSAGDDAFYCSQLVFKAYHRFGIDLNTWHTDPARAPLHSVVFPLEIWESCRERVMVASHAR